MAIDYKVIGCIGIIGVQIGIIIGYDRPTNTYKVLFADRVVNFPIQDIVVGPVVDFHPLEDCKIFKTGTKLHILKKSDNTFGNLRLGNKKGSRWFDGGYVIFLGGHSIILGNYNTSPEDPRELLIEIMQTKVHYVGDMYLKESDIQDIRGWDLSQAWMVLRTIVKQEKIGVLFVNTCPFGMYHSLKCSECTYRMNHGGYVCGNQNADYHRINENFLRRSGEYRQEAKAALMDKIQDIRTRIG